MVLGRDPRQRRQPQPRRGQDRLQALARPARPRHLNRLARRTQPRGRAGPSRPTKLLTGRDRLRKSAGSPKDFTNMTPCAYRRPGRSSALAPSARTWTGSRTKTSCRHRADLNHVARQADCEATAATPHPTIPPRQPQVPHRRGVTGFPGVPWPSMVDGALYQQEQVERTINQVGRAKNTTPRWS